MTLAATAWAAFAAHDLPDGMEPGLEVRRSTTRRTSRGHPARTRRSWRSTQEQVKYWLVRYVACDDVGAVVSEASSTGRCGRITQGIAAALYEGGRTTRTAACRRPTS